MRNAPATGTPGVAPIPLTCGLKNLAATLDITTSAVKPWISGTFARMAYPGILEPCHSIGKVIGGWPKMLKSYALCVYFQMYSASTTKYRPNACCRPAWNSLRKPGVGGVAVADAQERRAAITWFEHPVLATTRFSLKGVSSARA